MRTYRSREWAVWLALAFAVFQPGRSLAANAPSITAHPQPQGAIAGSNAVFTVSASGQPPLFYQWSFDGTNLTNSARTLGATNPALTISNVGLNDGGDYRVVVTNSYGSATSSNATLTVLLPPYMVVPPRDLSVNISGNASLTALAGGTPPLSFTWFFNGTPLTDGGRVTGSSSASLHIANVQSSDLGHYQVVVTNGYGRAASSNVTLGTSSENPGTVRYVNAGSTNPAAPYTDWSTAATNIQAAIDASSASDGDTVVVAPGEYLESINFNGKAIWLMSGADPSKTVINPPSGSSAITFASGENSNSVVSGFTITNGGISVSYSSPTIVSNAFLNCLGAGISCHFASPKILNNLISGASITGISLGGSGHCVDSGQHHSEQRRRDWHVGGRIAVNY